MELRRTRVVLIDNGSLGAGVYGSGTYGSGTYGQPSESSSLQSLRLTVVPLDETSGAIS